MNIKANSIFQIITNAAVKLQSEVTTALETYKKERDEAKRVSAQFKNEAEEYEKRRNFSASVARESINKANRVFANAVREQAEKLRTELMEHLNAPLNVDFCNQLALIREYGLKPTKAEVQHLIALNGGNSIGLSALRSVLTENDAGYRIKFAGTAEFEKDLETIEGLTKYPMYIPVNLHTEGSEVFRGVQRSFMREDGSSYHDGRTWDGMTIGIARADFEQRMKGVEGMTDRWSKDASYPSIEAVYTARKEDAERKGEESPAEPETSVRIEENDNAVESARARGRTTAEGQKTYDRAMNAYIKK